MVAVPKGVVGAATRCCFCYSYSPEHGFVGAACSRCCVCYSYSPRGASRGARALRWRTSSWACVYNNWVRHPPGKKRCEESRKRVHACSVLACSSLLMHALNFWIVVRRSITCRMPVSAFECDNVALLCGSDGLYLIAAPLNEHPTHAHGDLPRRPRMKQNSASHTIFTGRRALWPHLHERILHRVASSSHHCQYKLGRLHDAGRRRGMQVPDSVEAPRACLDGGRP